MIEISEIEERMNKSVSSLESEFATIRAGRANPHILDRVMVDYYGVPTFSRLQIFLYQKQE